MAGGLVAGMLDIAYAFLLGLGRRAVVYGAASGLVLYAVMNYVVVPLSAAGRGSKDPLWIVLGIVAHMVLVGIPIRGAHGARAAA